MGDPTIPVPQPTNEQVKLQKIADEIKLVGTLAAAIETAIPGAQGAAALTGLLTLLAARALNAASIGAGKPVTPATILELLPDQTPLVEPTAG